MKQKIALIGSGVLANVIVRAYQNGLLPDYEIVAVLGIAHGETEAAAKDADCAAVFDIEDVIDLNPDYVVEAAAVEAVRAYLPDVVAAGINFIPLSIGAFADADFLARTKELARKNGAKVHLPSGAIGGYDVLRTISLMNGAKMEFTMNKSRVNMAGTTLYDRCPESGEVAIIFEGNASQAIELLPGHVNVAVAASLATVGPDNMKVVIYSDPNDPEDEMRSRIISDKASANLVIRSTPPDIAGWSVVALLNNLASPVQFA